MDLQELIEFLGGASLFSAAFGYVGKAAVDAYFAGRIEKHEAELQRIATEHSVRFQRLHSERADTIKDIYARLAILDDALSSTLRLFQAVDEPSLVEKIQNLTKPYNELREYYMPRKIFFSESTCKTIDTILEQAHGIFIDINVYPIDLQSVEYKFNPEVLSERHEFWNKARNSHANEFKEVKAQLESSFRLALGIESQPGPMY